MPLTPLDVRKIRFSKKMWGCDPTEIESFLNLVAEELTGHLGELEKLERENRYYKQRLQEGQQRETQLQETLVRVQKVSEELAASARREAEVVIREAGQRADQIVNRAMEEAARVESKISQLRILRRELQLRFRQTLEFFERVLAADQKEEVEKATIRTLSRPRREDQPPAIPQGRTESQP